MQHRVVPVAESGSDRAVRRAAEVAGPARQQPVSTGVEPSPCFLPGQRPLDLLRILLQFREFLLLQSPLVGNLLQQSLPLRRFSGHLRHALRVVPVRQVQVSLPADQPVLLGRQPLPRLAQAGE